MSDWFSGFRVWGSVGNEGMEHRDHFGRGGGSGDSYRDALPHFTERHGGVVLEHFRSMAIVKRP